MKLEEWKQRYMNQKAEAEGNLLVVEAEAERLREVVLRLEGAIMAIDNLEKDKVESLPTPTPGENLTEEELQRALRTHAGLEDPPLEPEHSEDKEKVNATSS